MENLGESLEIVACDSDLKPLIESEVRRQIIKERAIDLCQQYPQAFKLVPADECKSLAVANGKWGIYDFDGVVNLWVNVSHHEALSFYKQISQEEREIMATQALTKKEDAGIKLMLKNNVQAIRSVLPKHITPERMLRIAYTAISRSPQLARCTQISLLNAVIEAATLGLEVNGPLGQASLVPFWNSRTNSMDAQLIPEYKGKIELAYRSGMVRSFQAHPVFEKDTFSYEYGMNPNLIHVPSKEADRGKLVAAYAVVNYLNGGVDFEVIEQAEAMKAKAKSASAKLDAKNKTSNSVWNSDDESSMWVKTAVHRLFKRIPKSPEYRDLGRAQELSDRAEAGEAQDFSFLDAEFSEILKDPPQLQNGKDNKAEGEAGGEESGQQQEMSTVAKQFHAMKQAIPGEIYRKALDKLGIKADTDLTEAMMKQIMKTCNKLADVQADGKAA